MAEDNTPVTTETSLPAPAEDLFIPRATFGKEDFKEAFDVLRTAGDPLPAFAEMLTNTLSRDERIQNRGPEYLNYNALREGRAGVLRDLQIPEGVGLTDAQIISLFARDPEGRPIQEGGGYFKGLAREAAPAAASFAGFMQGARLGNLAVSNVPPVTPLTAAVRLGVPLVTGIAGAVTADFGVRKAEEALIGEEPVFVPGTDAAFEAGKATMGALAFLPMPFLIPKNVNLGAKAVFDNIAADARAPFAARSVRFLESALERTGEAARKAPIPTGIVESGAVAGTGLAVYGAESAPGDSPWLRFGAELVGGVGGGMLGDAIIKRAPLALKGVVDGVVSLLNRFKETNAVNEAGQLSEGQQNFAREYLRSQLIANGEDPEKIVELLTSDDFSRFLVDEDGNPINLTAAEITASPTLLRIQMESGVSENISAQSKQKKAIDALRRGILFMYANGDQEALGQLAEIQTALWDAEISGQVQAATQGLRDRIQAVGEDVDNIQSAEKLVQTLENLQDGMRARETSLWKKIPRDIEITDFLDEDGRPTDVPNFITRWKELVPSEDFPEARAPILRIKELADLENFVRRKGEQLGLEGFGDAADAAAAPKLPEEARLTQAFVKIQGTPFEEIFEKISQNVQTLSPKDAVRLLREEATKSRSTDWTQPTTDPEKLPSATKRSRDYANALDRQADLIIARQQQPAVDGTPAPTGAVSAEELFKMRQTALRAGRELSAGGRNEMAGIAYKFAEALLDDLDSFPPGVDIVYDNARAYSRAYNDVFTRMYGGEILGTKKTGAAAIPVEVLANRMFTGDAGYFRAYQLDMIGQTQLSQELTTLLDPGTRPIGTDLLNSATQFGVINPKTRMLDKNALDQWFAANQETIESIPGLQKKLENIMESSASIRGASESLLRSARAAALDPDSRTLNVDALRRWMSKPDNSRLLDAMPALKQDLENVQTARQLLTRTTEETKALDAARRKGALSLYALLPDETLNPATQVSRAISLTNPKPFSELNNLWSYVDNIGEEGFSVSKGVLSGKTFSKQELVNGFRSAILESVFNRSGENGLIFNIDTAFRTLFEPHPNSPNKVSLAEWMKDRGVWGEGEAERTRRLLGRMAQIQAFSAKAKPADLEEFASQVGPLITLVTRISGSELGAAGQKVMSGSTQSLIARQAGSQFAQNVVNKYLSELPASLRMDVITTIVSDPQLLATVLRRTPDEEAQNRIGAMLVKSFFDNGILSSARRTIPAAENLGEQRLNSATTPASAPQTLPPAPAPAPRAEIQRPPVPPAQLPTQGGGAAPSPFSLVPAAPPQPPTQSSGPVDRARFAALFPEDRELLGIGSLMGG